MLLLLLFATIPAHTAITASVSSTTTVPATSIATACIPSSISRSSNDVGHLFPDSFGLEPFFLELLLVAEEADYNFGPFADWVGR